MEHASLYLRQLRNIYDLGSCVLHYGWCGRCDAVPADYSEAVRDISDDSDFHRSDLLLVMVSKASVAR